MNLCVCEYQIQLHHFKPSFNSIGLIIRQECKSVHFRKRMCSGSNYLSQVMVNSSLLGLYRLPTISSILSFAFGVSCNSFKQTASFTFRLAGCHASPPGPNTTRVVHRKIGPSPGGSMFGDSPLAYRSLSESRSKHFNTFLSYTDAANVRNILY